MAARCIESEILMHLRLWKNICNDSLVQDLIVTDKEGNEITLVDKKPFCIELQPIIKVHLKRTAVF